MQLAWVTDPHLNVFKTDLSEWVAMLRHSGADAVLITGDIMTARPHPVTGQDVVAFVHWLQDVLPMPAYFTLGNHDYYGGSIHGIRARLMDTHWLPGRGVIPLTSRTALLGHDGWGDGCAGNFMASTVMLNDYIHIAELARLEKSVRMERLRILGEECATFIRAMLPLALSQREHVLFATHVPPFREACWHEGQVSDDNWAPHFTCQAAGSALLSIMAGYPNHRLTVLCGHTHSPGIYVPTPNMTVFTGGAVYGQQVIQGVFDVDAPEALTAMV
jgi:predicted phosphohydrolase